MAVAGTNFKGWERHKLKRYVPMKELGNKTLLSFKEYLPKNYVWNDFTKYKTVENEFKPAISVLEKHRIRNAKRAFLSMLQVSEDEQQNHLYNLLAVCHLYALEYQECEYYIKKGLCSSVGEEYFYFLQCWFFIQRRAEIPGPASLISLNKPDIHSLEDPVACLFENKLFLEDAIDNRPYRQIRLFRKYVTEERFVEYTKQIKAYYADYSILSIYFWMGKLWIYDLYSIKKVSIDWRQILHAFDNLMTRNKEVLSKAAVTDEEKKNWWKQRLELDRKLGRLIKEVAKAFGNRALDRIILILDEWTIRFPFEHVFNKVAYRTRSLEALYLNSVKLKRCKAKVKSSFYLLDADNNLPRTRQCISSFIGRLAASLRIEGATGRPLSDDERVKLANQDLFMYFGHGSGRKHFNLDDIRPWITFLFGCSSCRLVCAPNFAYNGTLLTHLGKGRGVLGMLWDVTDKDLDQFTISFLECFQVNGDVGESLHSNIDKFRLKYLNGAAVVAYGCLDQILLQ